MPMPLNAKMKQHFARQNPLELENESLEVIGPRPECIQYHLMACIRNWDQSLHLGSYFLVLPIAQIMKLKLV